MTHSHPLRLDVVTIFPQYFNVLDLSLMGKAATSGLLDLHVHDLRQWTSDRHHTVDDTPLGGGAGMVMKPDVWGAALDDVLAASTCATRRVLVIPTPSGDVFTQRTAEDLAHADHLIFACGRYEGIDARVARYYRDAGVEVREVSIGDYVLNGGEVASVVMIEAVARLRPGIVGNPESVAEESHSAAGLLEYEVFTRPVTWRGLSATEHQPSLLSGHHARIARERRDDALKRTLARRPDMIARLDGAMLDREDRATLARAGWLTPSGCPHPRRYVLRAATEDDVPALVALARRTFPDACPAFLTAEQIRDHMDRELTTERFQQWVADPRVDVLIATWPDESGDAGTYMEQSGSGRPSELLGYAVLITESHDDDGALPLGLDPRPDCVSVPALAPVEAVAADSQAVEETAVVPDGGIGAGQVAELSKVYIDAPLRGSGLIAALLAGSVQAAAERGISVVWLGTYRGNRRAHKAYRRGGFDLAGTRHYDVGGRRCSDVVMACEVAKLT